MSYPPHKPHHTHGADENDPEPGALPVEPDDGAPGPSTPIDPEEDGAPAPEV